MSKIKLTDKSHSRDIKKNRLKDVQTKGKPLEKKLERYPEKSNYKELSERQRVESALQRKRDAHDRVLNTPRMEGFEKLGEKEQKEIKDYLANEHSDKHLNDINISKIAYHDNLKMDEKGNTVLGEWRAEDKGFKTKQGTIDIYNQGSEGKDLKEIKKSLSHETGHDVFFRTNSEKQAKWEKISGKREGADCVSPYATKSMREDFAESYSFYINHPNELKHINKDKYKFMKNEVFDQRTYEA